MGSIHTVKMPDIGEGVVEGEVVQWLKNVGDTVQKDEPVVIVMTDKATVELPSPFKGVIAKHHYKTGDIAKKDHPLYDVETPEKITDKPSQDLQFSETTETFSKAVLPSSGTILASPPIRKLARDLGIDIESIHGTGQGGIVTADDLKRCAVPPASGPVFTMHLADDEEIPLVGIRRLMAKKMKTAKSEIPHFSYFEQVDATRLIQLKQNLKKQAQQENLHLTYMPFLIKALSLTILQYPILNSMIEPTNDKIIVHKQQNVGFAVSTESGLIVPVLKNVEKMSLFQIVKLYEKLKSKAVEGKLLPEELKEATITISNFGVLGGGGLWATPIINFPEVAILAVAKIQKQPVVKSEQVVARDILNLSWSFDHRVIDGDLAASISHAFSLLIQNPAQLL